ncbi:MAG: transcription elongation factor GreA [Acidobacteria bacterium]|nr:transcription elongation factor GreA [Acidobacteriota bacterium]
MPDQQELSQEAHDRLKTELDELTGEGRIEIARKIEAARMLGDLSENGDYHAAKDQQGKMEARIRHLQGILRDATIVEAGASGGTVGVGSVVEVRFGGDSETEHYLVGSIEERHATHQVVSPGSPLGSSLMGASAGDVRSYEVGGRSMKVEVVAVQ